MTLARIPADGIKALHRTKARAYGHAWKKRGELIGIYANIARKVDRLEHHDQDPTSTDNESLAETLIDLYVYALKYLTFLADHNSGLAAELFPNSPAGTVFSDDVRHFEQLLDQRAAMDVSAPKRNPSAILEDLGTKLVEGGPIEARVQLAVELVNTVQHRVQAIPPNQVQALLESSAHGVT